MSLGAHNTEGAAVFLHSYRRGLTCLNAKMLLPFIMRYSQKEKDFSDRMYTQKSIDCILCYNFLLVSLRSRVGNCDFYVGHLSHIPEFLLTSLETLQT